METELDWSGGELEPTELADAIENGLPRELSQRLESALEDIAIRVRGDAQNEAPVDRGELRASLETLVENVGGVVFQAYVGSNLDSAAPMEFGTDPFFPPPSELRGWARRVLGDEDAAYPVARAISESGIEEQPYLRPAFDGITRWAVDRISTAVKRALEAVGLQ